MIENENEKIEVPPFQNNKVPLFLKIVYITLPIWGVIWFILFWNGSTESFLNRNYWPQLQQAANTKIEDFDH